MPRGVFPGKHTYKHGHSIIRSSEYISWLCMGNRCLRTSYKIKGITICDRWRGREGFINFLADMGNKPSWSYTLDRIDNTRGYYPENCRWSTMKVQSNNRGNKKWLWEIHAEAIGA